MDLGLTRQTVAEQLGCWYQSVASWEKDESEPQAVRWPGIEAVLGQGLVPEQEGLHGRIKAARLRLGLTQEDLARRAGVHVRTIRNTERAVYRPSRRTLRRLRLALGEVDEQMD